MLVTLTNHHTCHHHRYYYYYYYYYYHYYYYNYYYYYNNNNYYYYYSSSYSYSYRFGKSSCTIVQLSYGRCCPSFSSYYHYHYILLLLLILYLLLPFLLLLLLLLLQLTCRASKYVDAFTACPKLEGSKRKITSMVKWRERERWVSEGDHH